MFLFLLLVTSSLILPFRCSLFLFLNILLVSCLTFCRLSLLIWFGFCNHCNLAFFRWSANFEHSSTNHSLLCFNFWYHRFSLAEFLMFSIIVFQALLMSELSSKLSKAANLFQISTWYFSLTSMSLRFFKSNISRSKVCLTRLLTEILSLSFVTTR
jgi:hypothetical protein